MGLGAEAVRGCRLCSAGGQGRSDRAVQEVQVRPQPRAQIQPEVRSLTCAKGRRRGLLCPQKLGWGARLAGDVSDDEHVVKTFTLKQLFFVVVVLALPAPFSLSAMFDALEGPSINCL